ESPLGPQLSFSSDCIVSFGARSVPLKLDIAHNETRLDGGFLRFCTPPVAVGAGENGTHDARNTIATFTKPGTYNFVVTITDASGRSVASAVNVSVNETATSISVGPASAFV